jgi:hypothetical protein
MATNFPTNLDNLTNPTANTNMDAVGLEHDVQHGNLNDAVKAIETKVGITNSADTTSLDYLAKPLSGAGSPEGVVIASPGRLYWQVSTTLWVKNTGVGSTGWIELLSI